MTTAIANEIEDNGRWFSAICNGQPTAVSIINSIDKSAQWSKRPANLLGVKRTRFGGPGLHDDFHARVVEPLGQAVAVYHTGDVPLLETLK